MAFLLELKESFKKFYNRYNTYIVPASKFIIALICFIMINTSIGYMDKLKNPVFALTFCYMCISSRWVYTDSSFSVYSYTVVCNSSRICIAGIVYNASDVSSVFQICT